MEVEGLIVLVGVSENALEPRRGAFSHDDSNMIAFDGDLGIIRLRCRSGFACSTGSIFMDRDTFDAAIRTFKHHSPFRPFTLALVNGDRFEIDHPEAIVV